MPGVVGNRLRLEWLLAGFTAVPGRVCVSGGERGSDTNVSVYKAILTVLMQCSR